MKQTRDTFVKMNQLLAKIAVFGFFTMKPGPSNRVGDTFELVAFDLLANYYDGWTISLCFLKDEVRRRSQVRG